MLQSKGVGKCFGITEAILIFITLKCLDTNRSMFITVKGTRQFG